MDKKELTKDEFVKKEKDVLAPQLYVVFSIKEFKSAGKYAAVHTCTFHSLQGF